MIRVRNLILILLVFVALPALVAAQKTASEYAILLASLKGGNLNIDYARLRLSYVDSPEYKKAKDVSNPEKAMSEALRVKNYSEALKNAEIVLASEYVNMDAHFVAYVADHELGTTDKAEFHRSIFRSLVDSILHSGDGKSAEKAWVVINVHEEYVVLRALGFKPGEQSLQYKDGHAYDVMKVKSVDDGTEQTFYFNADIPIKHYGF